jgi:hypothetical protein
MRAFGALLLSLGGLAADARAAELDWRAPEPCPDIDELRFRVERAIGMPLRHAAPLRFVVNAEASGRGYTASIDVEPSPDATARRRALAATECSELVDMITVAVALALGADAPVESADAPVETADAPVETAPAARVAAPPDGGAAPLDPTTDAAAEGDRAARSGAPWSPALALWVLGDTGSLPRPGGGVALEARIERGRLGLRVTGTWHRGQHEVLPGVTDPAPGADLGLITGALSLCGVPFRSRDSALEVVGCAGWELGQLSGEGTDVQRPRDGAALWSAPKIDAGASLALGATPLRLGLMLSLVMPLTRENFVLGDLGTVHQPPGAVGRAALGLEWAPR